jgi:hypothetical protein
MAEPSRILLINNCQATPLAQILGLFCRDVRFEAFALHELPAENRDAEIHKLLDGVRENYDLVLSIPLSNEFGPLSTKRIAQSMAGKPTVIIPNFYFSGLHPDTFFLGGQGGRVSGPLGDYHSRLAVLAYVRNIRPEGAARLYCDQIFDGFGYYEEYEKSLAELRKREREVDVPFIAELEELLAQDLCFFTVNHPTSFLFSRFCHKLAKWLEAQGLAEFVDWPLDPSTVVNPLAENAIFPIFPEIAERFELRFRGNYIFKAPSFGAPSARVFDLDEFIRREYACLSEIPREALMRFPNVANLLDYTSASAI